MIPILGMGLKREEPRQIVAVGATMPTKGFCLEIFFFFFLILLSDSPDRSNCNWKRS